MLKAVQDQQKAPIELPAELPRVKPDPGRIAVLLNINARKVTDRLARKLGHIVGNDHVFLSRNLEEAEAYSREIVQRGYGTIVSGGGDGTLVRTVNLIHRYVAEANAWRAERYRRFGEAQPLIANPRFAFLRLGTGNGMSNLIGSGRPSSDLKRIVDYLPGRTQQIPLIEQEGERFFFAGLGYDSMILDDYNWLKARAKNWLSKLLMQNVTGYLMALAGRTLPRMLLGRMDKIEARVVTRGKAYYVNPRRGDFVEEIEPGSTLWEGPARLICAGTTPFYGYGFKTFPFARMMPGMMNLRIANLGPFSVLPFLRSAWKGSFRHPNGLLDFLVNDVAVELEKPFPFQHSGDAQGLRDRLDFQISNDNLELIDLYSPRRTH